MYATGAMEAVLAVALLGLPAQRRSVGVVIALYLALVFPANVYAAVAGVPVYPQPLMAWARLPVQPVFIAWALWTTR